MIIIIKTENIRMTLPECCRGTLRSQTLLSELNVCWWSEKGARKKQVNDNVHIN